MVPNCVRFDSRSHRCGRKYLFLDKNIPTSAALPVGLANSQSMYRFNQIPRDLNDRGPMGFESNFSVIAEQFDQARRRLIRSVPNASMRMIGSFALHARLMIEAQARSKKTKRRRRCRVCSRRIIDPEQFRATRDDVVPRDNCRCRRGRRDRPHLGDEVRQFRLCNYFINVTSSQERDWRSISQLWVRIREPVRGRKAVTLESVERSR
jgi:hypothetical protein